MLLWIDGFEAYNTLNASAYTPMTGKYGMSSWSSYYLLRAGRWSGLAVELYDSDIYFTTPGVLTTDPTLIVGFNFKTAQLADAVYYLSNVALWDRTTRSIHFCLRSTGEISVYRGEGNLLGTTSGANIQAGVWCHIELKVYCHNTNGTVTIRVNEQEKLNLTGINTKGGSDDYHCKVQFRGINSSCVLRFDDLYILDGTGAANNDFIGRKQVVAIKPNAAGDLTQWTPSAGSNYACVDEVPPSSSDYVSTDVTDNADLYNYESVPDLTGGIVGVQVNTQVLSTVDGVPWNVKQPVKSATQNDGIATLVTSTNTGRYITRLLETNPDTGSPWTLDELNAAQFGVKLA